MSYTFVLGIHDATGLCWGLSLPLTAVILRTIFIFPQIMSRRVTQKRLDVAPVMNAWAQLKKKELFKDEYLARNPKALEAKFKDEIKKQQKIFYKRHNCQGWKLFAPFMVQSPIFIAVLDTLRRMCGFREGLLSMVMGWTMNDSEKMLSHSLIPFQESMYTEGILWFENLTAMDYTFGLPILLSASMITTVYLSSTRFTGTRDRTRLQKYLTRTLYMVSFAMGPIMVAMPTAILEYWVSNMMMSVVVMGFMNIKMPLKLPPMKCKPKYHLNIVKVTKPRAASK
ncbi:MAG: hypothetical protein M1834_002037 [Cirrosporium novae-zelandiae]|nr:MAG: hypothetical protein M1834_002037 [Cirrosporium novae-zelandiae]